MSSKTHKPIFTLNECHLINGTAVVIDVMRAFTTAAFAFAAGVEEIILVGTPQEAFELKKDHPEYGLMGEVNGYPIPGFDFGNSPSALVGLNLAGKRLVFRTSAGTQGVIRSVNARKILALSLVNLTASVHYLQANALGEIGYVATGLREDDEGDEDLICAEAAIELFKHTTQPDWEMVKQRVRASNMGKKFSGGDPFFPQADLECALQVDRFNLVMEVNRLDQQFILSGIKL